MVDAVLLDLGNVLVFHDNQLLFRRLGECAGLGEEEVSRRISAELRGAMRSGALDEDGVRAEVNRVLGTRLRAEEFFELFNSHLTVHDEVLPLVAALVGRVKLGVLSNINPVHARWIRGRVPILKAFDAMLLSCEVRATKPDPRFYRAALDALRAEPSRTLFFDDIEAYVEGARALGIRGEVFTTAPAFARTLHELGVI